MRSLYLNLKDKTNPALRNALVTGELEADRLATMSKEEIASDRLKSLNAQIEKENLFKALAAGETMVRSEVLKVTDDARPRRTHSSAEDASSASVPTTKCRLEVPMNR